MRSLSPQLFFSEAAVSRIGKSTEATKKRIIENVTVQLAALYVPGAPPPVGVIAFSGLEYISVPADSGEVAIVRRMTRDESVRITGTASDDCFLVADVLPEVDVLNEADS